MWCWKENVMKDILESFASYLISKYLSSKVVNLQDSRIKQWRVQAVAILPNKFETCKPLPESWRGLRDDELSIEYSILDYVFIHISGFIGGNKSFNGALAMARTSLKLWLYLWWLMGSKNCFLPPPNFMIISLHLTINRYIYFSNLIFYLESFD